MRSGGRICPARGFPGIGRAGKRSPPASLCEGGGPAGPEGGEPRGHPKYFGQWQALSPTRCGGSFGPGPLPLRDISPHRGESPSQRGPRGSSAPLRGSCRPQAAEGESFAFTRSFSVLRCRLALGIGGIRVGALALRRGLGRMMSVTWLEPSRFSFFCASSAAAIRPPTCWMFGSVAV